MPFSTFTDIARWAGINLSPASNAAGDGTQVGPVVRPIQRKYASVSTTALLPANGTYISPWIDTQGTGGVFLFGQSFCPNSGSAANGFLLQGSNDIGNPNFTAQIGGTSNGLFVPLNVLGNIAAFCPYRFWRAAYTNNVTAQTSFELIVTECDIPPGITMGGSTYVNGWPTQWSIPQITQTTGAAPNFIGGATIVSPNTNGFGGVALDGGTTFESLTSPQQNGNISIAVTPQLQINGAFSGGSVAQRTPNTWRGNQFSGSGSNTIWQPPSTKKSRLMKYKIEVAADATLTGGAAPINLQFNQQLGTAGLSSLPLGTLFPYTHRLVVPGAAQSSFNGWDSGWIDLGNGGLGPAAGRALQMGIQVPQSTAAITSPTWTIASNQWEAATVGFKTNGNAGAFKLVQGVGVGVAGSAAAITATAMVTGNSYFVFFRTTNPAGGAPTVVVTDTALNTYTTGTLVTNASDGANGSSMGVAYVINAVGNAANVITITTSVNLATQINAAAFEYNGVSSGGGIDAAQVSATGNSASPASGNYTPATAGDLVFTFAATSVSLAAQPTAPAAFVIRGSQTQANGSIVMADNFGNGSLATGQINVIAIGTEE
jgi:hypothetical protein